MNLFKSKKHIYLDYASSTPLDSDVLDFMNMQAKVLFGNPSAIHKEGIASQKALYHAREIVAHSIGAHTDEILFTSGGTESNSLMLHGVILKYTEKYEKKPHVLISKIEHASLVEEVACLQKRGLIEVTYIPVDRSGFVDLEFIKKNIMENTVLVSVIHANNEIGVIQNIQEITKTVRHFRKNQSASFDLTRGKKNETMYPYLHIDACQSYVYSKILVEKLGVDLMTINSSKIYGPKGVGALYKKRTVSLSPLYHGGDQEFGFRPGTENLIGILGFAKAVQINESIKNEESIRLLKIRNYFISELKHTFDCVINGDEESRQPNNINVTFKGYSSEQIVIYLDAQDIYVSEKSACKSGNGEVSHVISALYGDTTDSAEGSIRISLGRKTSKKDMDKVIKKLKYIFTLISKSNHK